MAAVSRYIMKWIRERDALIAQTLAFVQSVTGRKEDFRQPDTAVVAPAALGERGEERLLWEVFRDLHVLVDRRVAAACAGLLVDPDRHGSVLH